MRNIFRFSAAPALALVLAACGGDAEQADAPADAAAETAATTEADGAAAPAGEDGAGAAGTAESPAEAGEPTPTPSASASAPTAAPSPAATPTRVAAAATPPAAFATCGVCHSVAPGQNGIGPSLAGVVGRRAGSVAGANYSPAMQAASVTWTEANLERYLADPNAVVPGTTMPNPGANPAARRAIIDYLKTL